MSRPGAGRPKAALTARRSAPELKIVTNPALMRRRGRQAGLLSMGGLVVLGVGLFLNLRGYAEPALVALFLGALASWIGVGLADKWLKPPRADVAIQRGLKGAGPAFALYHWRFPADHLLLAPWGLTVLVPVTVDGRVEISEGRWRERRPLYKKLLTLGRRPIGNPAAIAKLDIEAIRQMLASEAPQLTDVPVDAVAVFTQPTVVFTGEDSALAAVRADELREWIADRRKTEPLTNAARRELEKAVDGLAAKALEPKGGAPPRV